MDIIDKLRVLSADSQYDLACACGTEASRKRTRGLDGKWLYPVSLPQGGYTILLKTLLTNACSNDCKYCPLRAGSDVRRISLAPEEVASAFIEYYRRRKAFGLFLSSAVVKDPDYTMDRINSVARILREKHGFRGYMHLKVIPGASDGAIEDSLSLATAVSLNIETPARRSFEALTQTKDYERDIMRPLGLIGRLTGQGMRHSGVKCTTQFIVGASDEKDSEIVESIFSLYKRMNIRRAYFSSYQRGLGAPDIPGERRPLSAPDELFVREHRLYQTEFLIRKYGFERDDIIFDKEGNLKLDKDPKEAWADSHPEFFPMRLGTADREALLRVPGLGPETVRRILMVRRQGGLGSLSGGTPSVLDAVGLKGKRLERVRRYAVMG